MPKLKTQMRHIEVIFKNCETFQNFKKIIAQYTSDFALFRCHFVFAVMFCAKIDEVSSCNEDTVFENHRKCLIQIASEASYVYILSWQRFIRNAKNVAFWRIFENATFWVIFKQCASKIAVTNMLETSVESSMDRSGKMHL